MPIGKFVESEQLLEINTTKTGFTLSLFLFIIQRMNAQLRQQAVELRIKKQFSYAEIRERLNVSKSTLSYWLRELPLDEEKVLELRRAGWKKSEAGREKFRLTMRKKKEVKDLEVYLKYQAKFSNIPKMTSFIAGLMLYLGEGTKTDPSKLVLANTDPKVIKFYIYWLNEFLGVPKENMKAWLHLYENMDIEKEKEFWRRETGLSKEQFYELLPRPLKKSSFSYKDSNRHGTCSIYIGGVEKNREVRMAIKAFLDTFDNGLKGT